MKLYVIVVILSSILGIGSARRYWGHNYHRSKFSSSEEIFRRPPPRKEVAWTETKINRARVIDHEDSKRLGGDLPDRFSDKQKKVNDILTKVRNQEMDDGQNDAYHYAPGMHFFKAKALIEKSKVFKFIKKMPKGAVLHGHNTAMVSSDWFLSNITYRNGLRMCTYQKDKILTFRTSDTRCEDALVLVSDERSKATDKTAFDEKLRRVFDLYTPTPEIDYPYITDVWNRFQYMFGATGDVIAFYSVFRDYHYQLFQELYDDNVMYAELRTSFGEMYDENGRVYTINETIKLLQDIIANFKKTHPGFVGAKFIYSARRGVTPTAMQAKIDIFKTLYKQYPNFVIGFDMVGQEDLGRPIIDFVDNLNTIAPSDAKFFFHAGETDWYGTATDYNLVDALLMRTQRIGHAYSLYKHPTLWRHVRRANVGLEVSPISNQVLDLVWDLRNHPGAFYIAENLPMVITCDDPGFWHASGISYDHYYALMSFAPYGAGLEVPWQLVYNSIKYSTLTPAERFEYERLLFIKWDKFYDDVIAGKVI